MSPAPAVSPSADPREALLGRTLTVLATTRRSCGCASADGPDERVYLFDRALDDDELDGLTARWRALWPWPSPDDETEGRLRAERVALIEAAGGRPLRLRAGQVPGAHVLAGSGCVCGWPSWPATDESGHVRVVRHDGELFLAPPSRDVARIVARAREAAHAGWLDAVARRAADFEDRLAGLPDATARLAARIAFARAQEGDPAELERLLGWTCPPVTPDPDTLAPPERRRVLERALEAADVVPFTGAVADEVLRALGPVPIGASRAG